METLGDILRKARINKKLTMRKLGDCVSLSPIFISDLENGKRIPIKGEALKTLASFFNLDYLELLDIAKTSKLADSLSKNVDSFETLKALARNIEGKTLSDKQIEDIIKIINRNEENK